MCRQKKKNESRKKIVKNVLWSTRRTWWKKPQARMSHWCQVYLVPGTIMTLISLMGIHTTYISSYALPVLSYELLPAKYIDKDDRCYLFNSCFIQHMAVSICRTCSSSTTRTHSTYDIGIQSSLRINRCRRM